MKTWAKWRLGVFLLEVGIDGHRKLIPVYRVGCAVHDLAGRLPVLLLAGLLLACASLPSAELQTNASPARTTIAVMPWLAMEPPPLAPEDRHWLRTFNGLIASELRQVAAVRVVPEDIVVRELARQNRAEPDHTNAAVGFRKLGENVRAQWLISGFLTGTQASWTVRGRAVEAATGQFGEVFSATSTNWFELRDQFVRHVLQRLNIAPSPADQQRLGKRWTTSLGALEWASQAMSRSDSDSKQTAELCRKALAADPQFLHARALLAVALFNLGRDDEALGEARQALSQKPDDSLAGQLHALVADLLSGKRQADQAAREVADGLRVSPENLQLLARQARLYEQRGDFQGAGDCLRKAVACDPHNPALYAKLGRLQSRQGALTNALANLDLAVQLAMNTLLEEQLDFNQALAEGYETVGDLTNALRHYRGVLSIARASDLSESRLEGVQEAVLQLERRSQPVPVAVGRPMDYSVPGLQAALRERLTPEELALAVNPIASTPAMARWAGEIVGATQGDLARARQLFDLLASRPKAAGGASRTAPEVFASWADLSQSFCCQEYAKLFVALARSVGLLACYVHVDRDYAGTIVDHDCAVLFAEGKAWLVDPAYAWFGIPHREFRVLDDLQAVAHHAFQPHGGTVEVSLCRAGLKLDPDFVWGRMSLVVALIESGRNEEAGRELEAARKQAPEFWRGYQLEGMLALKQGHMDQALEWLRKAVEANPGDGDTRLALAQVLFHSGKRTAAREEVLLGLRRPHSSTNEKSAREMLALIEGALGLGAAVPTPSDPPLDAASYGDLGASFLSGSTPDYAEAAKWFRKAAELGEPRAQCILGVLYWNGRGVPKDPTVAIGWFRKAAQGGDAEAMRHLGLAYDSGVGVAESGAEAMRWLRRAAEAGDPKAQLLVGKACYTGSDAPKDRTEALFWLMLATGTNAVQPGPGVGIEQSGPTSVLRQAQALRKEVELFASPEEIARAKVRLESVRAKQPSASSPQKAPPASARQIRKGI